MTQLVLSPQGGTAKTPFDVLSRESFADLQTAALPPDRHRGVLFRTPDDKLVASKRRESLLIGELKDKKSGIIHYAINTPGVVRGSISSSANRSGAPE